MTPGDDWQESAIGLPSVWGVLHSPGLVPCLVLCLFTLSCTMRSAPASPLYSPHLSIYLSISLSRYVHLHLSWLLVGLVGL